LSRSLILAWRDEDWIRWAASSWRHWGTKPGIKVAGVKNK
jgi:hypothetical protein